MMCRFLTKKQASFGASSIQTRLCILSIQQSSFSSTALAAAHPATNMTGTPAGNGGDGVTAERTETGRRPDQHYRDSCGGQTRRSHGWADRDRTETRPTPPALLPATGDRSQHRANEDEGRNTRRVVVGSGTRVSGRARQWIWQKLYGWSTDVFSANDDNGPE